tara:strand:+ start:1954 stop:2397 length:444 start_codon:yes stop_codon:yes gene_type:complete
MNQSDFKEGNHDSFIQFLYSSEPKEKGSIQLELPCSEENKSQALHIFEQLLMIFVDGLKYFYGDENKKVNVENLQEKDFEKMNLYFKSLNFKVDVSIFKNMYEYQFKHPNYFKDKKLITNDTKLNDFYYEIFSNSQHIYRIQFDFLI